MLWNVKSVYRLPQLTPTTYLYTSSILPVEKLAVVERIGYLHKIVKSLTKNNFDVRLNNEIHSHRTRQADDLHCSDKHPALKQSTMEYNRFCKGLTHLMCMKTFKAKLKIEVMRNSGSEYSVVSPYVFLNWTLELFVWICDYFGPEFGRSLVFFFTLIYTNFPIFFGIFCDD